MASIFDRFKREERAISFQTVWGMGYVFVPDGRNERLQATASSVACAILETLDCCHTTRLCVVHAYALASRSFYTQFFTAFNADACQFRRLGTDIF